MKFLNKEDKCSLKQHFIRPVEITASILHFTFVTIVSKNEFSDNNIVVERCNYCNQNITWYSPKLTVNNASNERFAKLTLRSLTFQGLKGGGTFHSVWTVEVMFSLCEAYIAQTAYMHEY